MPFLDYRHLDTKSPLEFGHVILYHPEIHVLLCVLIAKKMFLVTCLSDLISYV